MKFEVELAKDGNQTLKLNEKYIYSKYAPIKDAQNFVLKEYDENARGYILVGLGLGYHLEQLFNLTNKRILLLPVDEKEIELYLKYSKKSLLKNIELFSNENDVEDYQILIPNAFLNGVGEQHPLYDLLNDIKIRQRSYKMHANLLHQNFLANITLNDVTHTTVMNTYEGAAACLVSAGPSLDEMMPYIALAKANGYYILAVGSALKSLLVQNVIPDAVIITDGQDNIQNQIKDTNYNGLLYYLSTANHGAVLLHQSDRVMLLQKGYGPAEEYSTEKAALLETGGSVATTAFSLLEYMGFQKVILFGQDLGFKGDITHSVNSTSAAKKIKKNHRQILANDGSFINTLPNLYSYLRWFEQKFCHTNVEVFNTAIFGAKIKGTTFLNKTQLELLITSKDSCI